jgi:hypothetical protein
MFMSDDSGKLVQLYPHSGHYRPSDGHLYNLLRYFESAGIDLSAVQVDAQRTYKTARPENDGGKVRKVSSSSLSNNDCVSTDSEHCHCKVVQLVSAVALAEHTSSLLLHRALAVD